MPVVIQKGGKPLSVAEITPEQIRDLLLSLPDNERKFIITNPVAGERKVFSVAQDEANKEIVFNT